MDTRLIPITLVLIGSGVAATAHGFAPDEQQAPPKEDGAAEEEAEEEEHDYSAPGSSGEEVEGEPLRGVEMFVDRLLPTTGSCDEESEVHTVLATTRQQVKVCGGFDHGKLYKRAREQVETMGEAMTCPDGCTKLQWTSYHRWGCLDLFDPAIASASVELSVQCAPEGTPAPESLPVPDAMDLKGAEAEQEGDGPQHENAWIDEVGGTVSVPCNAKELAVFDFQDAVDACAPLDYQPFVTEATTRAQAYDKTIGCAAGCSRNGFTPVRTEWSCSSVNGTPTVRVQVFSDVQCK